MNHVSTLITAAIHGLPTLVATSSGRVNLLARAALFTLLAVLTQTYLRSGDVPLVLKVFVLSIGILAAVRPSAGLLAFAAVVPFTRILTGPVFHAPATTRFTEAFALAFLNASRDAGLDRPPLHCSRPRWWDLCSWRWVSSGTGRTTGGRTSGCSARTSAATT
jgi:hypothetical protein